MDQTLAGKVAVITGGTQGLGETVARQFAARGAAGLVISGRNQERGEAVARDLTAGGCRTLFAMGELGELDAVRKVIATADDAFGKLHALVNAAALTDRGTILDTTPDLFDRMFAVNVRAPFFLMQDAAKIMRREKIAGTIVSIQSMSGHGGQSFLTAYSTSKLSLIYLVHGLARRLPAGIAVFSFNPGLVPGTGLVRDSGAVTRFLFRRVLPIMTLTPFARTRANSGADLAAAATGPLTAESGSYINGAKIERSSPESYDPGREDALWDELTQLTTRRTATADRTSTRDRI